MNSGESFFENAKMLQVESLARGFYASYELEEQQRIIRGEKGFESFWSDLNSSKNPVPKIPIVDFNDHIVIVSIMGTQNSGGYVTEITDVGIVDNKLGIQIKNTRPGDGCVVTGALTNPFHMVKVVKTGLSVTYFKEEATNFCSE